MENVTALDCVVPSAAGCLIARSRLDSCRCDPLGQVVGEGD